MSVWPRHLGSRRAFQRRKRREYRALVQAAKTFRMGCAYLPPLPERDLGVLLGRIERMHATYKDWWRKA